MQTAITITIILGILLIISIFISAILFVLHFDMINHWFNATIDNYMNNNNNRIRRTRRTRQRRNAIYIPPPPIREIELTPLPKKNFIIIENPDSPYTLGIEHSTE
tara:strand:- start:4241 stop:4555 length:315 start_codon:yes stop_codon:yes gene_type:complete